MCNAGAGSEGGKGEGLLASIACYDAQPKTIATQFFKVAGENTCVLNFNAHT